MDDFEPGAPSLEVSVTPGTAPAKASVTFVTCDCSSFSVPTTLAEPVNADFFAVPPLPHQASQYQTSSPLLSWVLLPLLGSAYQYKKSPEFSRNYNMCILLVIKEVQ